MACRSTAYRSTSAVTNGLPSRSPPIHEPIRSTGCRTSWPVRPASRQLVLERLLERGHLLEQRQLVVAERIVDLVAHAQARQSQHGGLPEREHLTAQRPLPLGALDVVHEGAVGAREEPRDLPLRVEHRLAPHLGRMRGEHGADEQVAQERRDRVGVQTGGVEALDGEAQRPGTLGCAGAAPLALLMDVLRDVGQEREQRRGADHAERVVVGEAVEMRGQLRRLRARPTRVDGELARAFDQLEGARSGLLADDVAEDAAEEADVVAKRRILFGVGERRIRGSHVADRPVVPDGHVPGPGGAGSQTVTGRGAPGPHTM